jgi:hypothetical protein
MKKTMKTKHFIIAFFTLVLAVINANANNMLVQNVTTLNDNPTDKTIQVQFDLSWDNSWRDSINWDAAWIFLKFKDANGLWQHAKLNTNGFQNGSGTTNTVQVTSDKVGAWVYRDTRGSGTFNSTSMQLQWNYGLSGLSKVTGLEVRVFAVEMVYVPEGGFMTSSTFWAGNINNVQMRDQQGSLLAKNVGYPVLNDRLTPSTKISIISGEQCCNDQGFYRVVIDTISLRIKANVGIDTNNNGTIDNTTYPTGFKAFYTYKYELTEQQYADFLNTLTTNQITPLGIAGVNISLNNNQYFTSTPNKSCGNSNPSRFFAYADWSGLRPMSFWELQKAHNGNQGFNQDVNNYRELYWGYHGYNIRNGLIDVASADGFKIWGANIPNPTSNYGITELVGNAFEPVMAASNFNFTTTNGDGIIQLDGSNNIKTIWNPNKVIYMEFFQPDSRDARPFGFRYVRSAE